MARVKKETSTAVATVTKTTNLPAERHDQIENYDPSKLTYYKEIARSLNVKDLSSVGSYGSDLQRAMDSYSSEFLNQQMSSSTSIESAQLIANLLGELKEVDIDDLGTPNAFKKLLRRVPLLKKFVVSVEQIKAKYNTIQKNIDGIVEKLEATRLIAIRDCNLLEKQFENNLDYVRQLEDLIIAGQIKLEELDHKLDEMNAAGTYEDYQIGDVSEYRDALNKRINDLIMLRFAFKQSLNQIRLIQRTNMMDANNTESQLKMTIPLWKNQLSLAVALYNQKQSVEIKDKVTQATNDILKKNAEMMKTQTIEIVQQSQRSVIDIETLRKTTQDMIATVEGVEKAKKEYARISADAVAEVAKLEKQLALASNSMQESTHLVISKELKGLYGTDSLEEIAQEPSPAQAQ